MVEYHTANFDKGQSRGLEECDSHVRLSIISSALQLELGSLEFFELFSSLSVEGLSRSTRCPALALALNTLKHVVPLLRISSPPCRISESVINHYICLKKVIGRVDGFHTSAGIITQSSGPHLTLWDLLIAKRPSTIPRHTGGHIVPAVHNRGGRT